MFGSTSSLVCYNIYMFWSPYARSSPLLCEITCGSLSFAVNQWDPTNDLGENGEGLGEAMRLSSCTLMVLDRAGLPLSRLWCLYEVSLTPAGQLELLTHGSDVNHLMKVHDTFDVKDAQCFNPTSEKMIRAHIQEKFGSQERLTELLKAKLASVALASAFRGTPHAAAGGAATTNDKAVHVRALVVGVGNYESSDLKLPNPPNDAQALAESLRAAGADVLLVLDPTLDRMTAALRQFADPEHKALAAPLASVGARRGRSQLRQQQIRESKVVGIFFFAGHGLEVDGENLLVPADFLQPAEDMPESRIKAAVKSNCLRLNFAMQEIGNSGFRVSMVLLDCCRNWPFRDGSLGGLSALRGLGGAKRRGLGQVDARPMSHDDSIGSMISFAAAAGAAALDSCKHVPGHSPYTAALLQVFALPGIKLDLALARVTDFVVRDTGGVQEPASYKHRWGEEACNLVLFPTAVSAATATEIVVHSKVEIYGPDEVTLTAI